MSSFITIILLLISISIINGYLIPNQLFSRRRTNLNGMIDLVDQTFDELVLDSNTPVIVDFHANWCGPCKLMAPIFKELADEYSDSPIKFVKVDTDLHEEAVDKFNIQGLPLFAFFKDGEVVASHSGAISREPLKEFIEKHINA